MTDIGFFQIALYLMVVFALVKPLGWYMARVYENKPCGLDYLIGPLERFVYRLCGIRADQEMDWKNYLLALLLLNMCGLFAVYGILRLQIYLPLNPQHFSAVPADMAFNTAVSFATNTDWQNY